MGIAEIVRVRHQRGPAAEVPRQRLRRQRPGELRDRRRQQRRARAANRYDLVYLQHAYHHIERLERRPTRCASAQAVRQPRDRRLRRGQLPAAHAASAGSVRGDPGGLCPSAIGVRPSGRAVRQLRIPDKASLSPYEAVRAEDILAVLDARFERRESFFFGGILYPLFNGIGQNFTGSETDQDFLRVMWDPRTMAHRQRQHRAELHEGDLFVPRP